jgi:hypothetical protein
LQKIKAKSDKAFPLFQPLMLPVTALATLIFQRDSGKQQIYAIFQAQN